MRLFACFVLQSNFPLPTVKHSRSRIAGPIASRINYADNSYQKFAANFLRYRLALRALKNRATIGCLGVNTCMLMVYLEPFVDHQRLLLEQWTPRVVTYWPRSHVTDFQYDYSVVTDWWLLFSQAQFASLWLLQYPEHSRVVRTLFD